MLNERTIIEQEYKWLRILKDGNFHQACRTNRAVIKESLYQIQIIAWLEGHVNLDTGLLNKSDNLSYEIQELSK